MSIQFGRWNFDGPTTEPEYLNRGSGRFSTPYGPDRLASYSVVRASILY